MQSANYCGGRALRHSAYLHDCGNEGVRRSTVGCGWHLRTHQVNTTRQSDNVGHGALHVLRWRVPEHVTRTHARTPPHTDTQTPTHPCDATQHRLVWPCSCTRCRTHLVSLALHDGLQHQAEAIGLFWTTTLNTYPSGSVSGGSPHSNDQLARVVLHVPLCSAAHTTLHTPRAPRSGLAGSG